MKRALSYSFVAQIIAALSALVLSLLIGQQFGPEGTGRFFEFLMIVSVAGIVARFGMDNVLTRHVATARARQDKGYAARILGVARNIGLKASIVAILLSVLFYWLWKGELNSNALILIAIPFVVLSALYSSGLRGLGYAWAYTLFSRGIAPLVASLAIAIYWLLSRPITITQLFVFYLLGVVVAWFFARRLWIKSTDRISPQQDVPMAQEISWRTLWSSCRHLFPVSLLNLAVFPWAAIFFLSTYATLAEVGMYAVADRVVSQIGFVLVSVGHVVSPKFTALHEQGKRAELEGLARKSALLVSAITLPVIALLFFFDSTVLSFFGEEFSEGAIFMDILLIGSVVNVLSGNVGMLLMMTGHEKETKYALYGSATVLLVSMALLIPLVGGIGAAIGYSLAIILQNVLLVYFVIRKLGINPLPGYGGKCV